MADLALITGSEGFLGRAVRAAFEKAGFSSYGIGRRPAGVEPYSSIDLREESATVDVETILVARRPRWLIHVAGVPGAASLRDNVEPLRTVVAALERSRLPTRLLAIGSAAEYGNQGPAAIDETFPGAPVSEYGAAKLAATQIVLRARPRGLDASVARVFNLLGFGMADDLAPSAFLKRLRDGDTEMVSRNSEAVRDYLEVGEAARGILALATHVGALPPIINVCSGEGTRMGDLFEELAGQSGLALGRAIARDGLVGSLPVSVGDPGLFERLCGWRPTFRLASGVRSMLGETRRVS